MTAVTEASEADALPREVGLEEAFPNPFNADSILRFQLPGAGRVQLMVYNALGQRVRHLLAGEPLSAGIHQVRWDGRNDAGDAAASGVYYARLEALGERRMRSLVLLR